MSYGSGPAPYGEQPPYSGQAPYGGGPTPYNTPNQFGVPALSPDVAPLPGASFGEAVKRFFQRYAQFRGYASRSEFWWAFLFLNIVFFVLYLVMFIGIGSTLSTDSSGESAGVFSLISGAALVIVALGTLIPYLAVMVRRLHDSGRSGLFVLLILVGLGIVPIVLCCFESRPDLYRPEWS